MKLCQDGKNSLMCFILAAMVAEIPEILLRIEMNYHIHHFSNNIWFIHVFQLIFLNLLVFLAFKGFTYQVAVRSIFLGYGLGLGILITFVAPPTWKCFGLYTAILTTFHYSEFLSIAWTNPKSCSIGNFLLWHSLAYGIAVCSCCIEYLIERYYFPIMKYPCFISYLGLIICISGEILRKLAIFTAQHNFNHVVQTKKLENHELVTHGVYKFFRHPSYVGWFYWSIGTQLVLQNPLCMLAYSIVSWKFFENRIVLEEIRLLNFFGQQYVNYQKKVGTGLPFISGYTLDT